MAFPDSERVLYAKNPLKQVICQLTFPAILRLDSESPFNFQEAIIRPFPNLSEEHGTDIKFMMPVVPAEGSPPNLKFQGKKVYKFTSDDGKWYVTLTRDSLALSTTEYRSWVDFQERFDESINALCDLYNLTHFTRLGLRYINVIDREELGLEGVPWWDLLSSPIAGELGDVNVRKMITGCANQVTLIMEDGTNILLNHGLAMGSPAGKVAYLIDSDFSTTEKTEVANVRKRLKEFNNNSGRLFRWCISQSLHDALEPGPSSSQQSA